MNTNKCKIHKERYIYDVWTDSHFCLSCEKEHEKELKDIIKNAVMGKEE